MQKIHVSIPGAAYDVLIKAGLLNESGAILRSLLPHHRAFILCDKTVAESYGEQIQKSISAVGYSVLQHPFPAAESQKHADTVAGLHTVLLENGIERKSPVIAVGGGVTGDVVGYAAATVLRGVPFVQVPTTLLAMVDSSVGGKVGVNHPQGKNLIGAFYQPRVVLIDPLTLHSLPKREFCSGIAECIKHGLLADKSLFLWIQENIANILNLDPICLEQFIARNVQIKAKIVVEDEREEGIRAHLNLGHTFGHAIESVLGYGTLLHGEAVALGLIAAAWISQQLGSISESELREIEALIAASNLSIRAKLPPNQVLLDSMMKDKKVKDGKLRLVILESMGKACIRDDIPQTLVEEAWDYIRD